jgi:hypothetical protein
VMEDMLNVDMENLRIQQFLNKRYFLLQIFRIQI